MIRSVLSWEFFFFANIFLVLLLPWLLRRNHLELKFFAVLLAPYAAICIELMIVRTPVDLGFALQLCFFHLTLSTLTAVATWSADPRTSRYYLAVFGSLVVSLLTLFFSSSLKWMDLFWGVFPGTVSLDPIISLRPFLWRAVFVVFAFVAYLKFRRTVAFVLSFWLLLWVSGIFIPNTYVPEWRLQKEFGSHVSQGPFEIFVEDPEHASFSTAVWGKEFQFRFEQITKKFPKLQGAFHFKIFIFSSDRSKGRWIGARNPQIGNFVHGQMQLSEITPMSSVLSHELVHLIHGQLKTAPFSSYLDPFIFEGFAVAASSSDLEEPLEMATALKSECLNISSWPKGLAFFSRYAPSISYALAGAYSAQALKENLWPWQLKDFQLEQISETPTSEEKTRAKAMCEQKPVLGDVVTRDCARLQDNFDLRPTFKNWKKLKRICSERRQTFLSVYQLEPEDRILALERVHSEEAQGDLALTEGNALEAETHYHACSTKLCYWKEKALKDPHLARALKQEITNGKDVVLSIVKLFPNDPEAVEILTHEGTLKNRLEAFEQLGHLKPLSAEQELVKEKMEFYSNLENPPDFKKATSVAKTLLKNWKWTKENADAEFFRRRLEYEIDHPE